MSVYQDDGMVIIMKDLCNGTQVTAGKSFASSESGTRDQDSATGA